MTRNIDSQSPWKPVSLLGALSVAGSVILVAWMRQANPDRWVHVLDDANLVFHEAGHPIFGLLGPVPGLYGGTLGQLVFPVAASVEFRRQRATVPVALCLVWLFENFLNISRYMADARAQILPLVGSGEHDWTTIFVRWGVLPHDLAIAGFVSWLGWLGILGCGLWICFRFFD